jgi:hypothetical protein
MVLLLLGVGYPDFSRMSLRTDFTPGVARASSMARWISRRLSAKPESWTLPC